MNREENNGVTFMTFDILKAQSRVKHGFSTKLGGVSEDVFATMNLGFGRGDSDENVHENYKRMATALNMNYKRMCLSQQTHTTNIRVITEKDAGNGITQPLPYTDIDGMITNIKDLPLVTFYADCVPLFFYDPHKEVIGLSHSGWRGTVGKIGTKTVELMNETFGCNPKDIICCVGPSICKHCYEVSSDVARQFDKKFTSQSIFNPKDPDKYMLDLWGACKQNFIDAGVLESNIEITDYCTRCNPDLFYSHRIMGAHRGSLAAFMSL